jgi:hypothetical protein
MVLKIPTTFAKKKKDFLKNIYKFKVRERKAIREGKNSLVKINKSKKLFNKEATSEPLPLSLIT